MVANLLTSVARSAGLSTVMRAACVLTRLLPISQPTLVVGPGASARLGHGRCQTHRAGRGQPKAPA